MKKLGSLLGCYEDMTRRIQLSYAAFNSIKQVWLKQNIHWEKKLTIYKSIVKPVLTYNFGTWGLTKKEQNEIDVVHRRQLRSIIKDKKIKNKKLYEKCKEEPISKTMKHTKWRLLGHIFRLPETTPAQQAMKYYFEIPKDAKKFPGNKRITLPTSIDQDIKTTLKNNPTLPVKQFTTTDDLRTLKQIAQDRKRWSDLSKVICLA